MKVINMPQNAILKYVEKFTLQEGDLKTLF